MSVSKMQLKCIIILTIITLSLTVSGCTEKEKKYVQLETPDNYISFNTQTERVFIHWGSVGAAYQGDYKETANDFTLFIDNSREQVIFTKFDNDSISLAPDYPEYFVHEKGTVFQQMGF